MAAYLYVGRRRHPVRLIVYQILTLGVFGRVYLYKLLREFDGHEALFLDRRPYIPLLVLPVVGPFFVKRRVLLLLEDLVHHDVTHQPLSHRKMLWLALIPLVPLFHLRVLEHVNHHWKMHTKEEELRLKGAQLDALGRRSRTKENVEAAQALGAEVAQRGKELEDLRQAAIALRDAEDVRRLMDRDRRRTRGSSFGMVRKLTGAALSRVKPRFRRAGSETELVETAAVEETEPRAERKVDHEEAHEEEPAPDAEPVAAAEGEAKPTQGLFSFLRRAPKAAEGQELSRAERKEAKRRAKEERRAAKAAERDARRRAKDEARAAARAEKEAEEEAAAKADAPDAQKAKPGSKKTAEKGRGGKRRKPKA